MKVGNAQEAMKASGPLAQETKLFPDMSGGWFWIVIQRHGGKEAHTLPINDLREHETVEDCWCDPKLEALGDGDVHVTHASADGREKVERGKAN